MNNDTLEVMIFDDGSDVLLNFYGRCMELTPEQKMMKALLEITIQDATKPRNPELAAEKIRRDALDFIASDDEEYVFSFVNLCEGLGLNPAAVRKELQAGKVDLTPASSNRIYVKRRLSIDSMMDKGFSHVYYNQNHCPECSQRYHAAYRNFKLKGPRRRRREIVPGNQHRTNRLGRPVAEGETAA